MSTELVDAAPQRTSSDAATLASLPLPLAQRIFLALPVDARGRASCVCRAWRAVLADPSLWTRLVMSDVRGAKRLKSWLRGAAGRAHGQLREMELSHEYAHLNELLPVLTANAGSLRELHLFIVIEADKKSRDAFPSVKALMAAAPLLQVLKVEEMTCSWKDAPRVLRAKPPFGAVQLQHTLEVRFAKHLDHVSGMERVAPFAAVLADAALQPALSRLEVWSADTHQPAVMGALADAAVARRLRELSLEFCTSPDAAQLARLLAEGSLTVFEFEPSHTNHIPLFDAAAAALVADALRVNTTLTELKLCEAQLCLDIDAAGILLGALVGHPSLRELWISGDKAAAEDRNAFGTAVAALIAADAPALFSLVCWNTALGDEGLAPIVEALALNRHLRELDLDCNGMSEAFAREQLLPAVWENTTLRNLTVDLEDEKYDESEPPAAAEAMIEVNYR